MKLRNYSKYTGFLIRLGLFLPLFYLFWTKMKYGFLHELVSETAPFVYFKPEIVVYVMAIFQIIIAVMLIIGFFTRIAAFLLALASLVAIYIFISYMSPEISRLYFMMYIPILFASLSLFINGAGVWSIDHLRYQKRYEKYLAIQKGMKKTASKKVSKKKATRKKTGKKR